MRITRSGLRKIIAEEHARILAETKTPKRDEDKTDEDWAEEQLQGVMDMYGHPDPYGDEEAEEMGYEYDGAGGWIKPGTAQTEDEDEDDYTYGDDPEEFMDLPAGEIQRRMRDLDEADKGPSPLAAAEGRLRAAIKDIHPTKASSLTKRVLDLIDDVMMEEAISAEADGTDEFPFNASVRVLEQMGDKIGRASCRERV
jgi:hypothetical protein